MPANVAGIFASIDTVFLNFDVFFYNFVLAMNKTQPFSIDVDSPSQGECSVK